MYHKASCKQERLWLNIRVSFECLPWVFPNFILSVSSLGDFFLDFLHSPSFLLLEPVVSMDEMTKLRATHTFAPVKTLQKANNCKILDWLDREKIHSDRELQFWVVFWAWKISLGTTTFTWQNLSLFSDVFYLGAAIKLRPASKFLQESHNSLQRNGQFLA